MKKTNSLLLVFFLATALTHAQQNEQLNRQKDVLQFQGYTIRLLPAMGGTYGYCVVKGKQLIVMQNRNPFTASPNGLSRKEDAYKVAQWQIQQLKAGKQWGQGIPLTQGKDLNLPPSILQKLQMQGSRGPAINQRIPKKVAEELQITINN